jgi:hypothetical protein
MKNRPGSCAAAFIVLIELLVIIYIVLYVTGNMPHNSIIEWLLDGIRKNL